MGLSDREEPNQRIMHMEGETMLMDEPKNNYLPARTAQTWDGVRTEDDALDLEVSGELAHRNDAGL